VSDKAILEADGSCSFFDRFEEQTTATWPSLAAWAVDWISEWKINRFGPASDFAHAMTEEPADFAVAALVVLAASAEDNDDNLGMIGAGPLEDLLSHSGHGALMLESVAAAARQEPAFRKALTNVWLSKDVPENVRLQLGTLGARLIH
jgi:hypothetical protein